MHGHDDTTVAERDRSRTLPSPARPQFPDRPDELRAELHGALTRTPQAAWVDSLIELAARRPRRLVLDMRRVTKVDAGAVRTLLALEKRLLASGGRMVVHAGAAAATTLTAIGAGHLIRS